MCFFEQTQYAGCGHNVEVVTEKCPEGEKYRTSMHDKVILALHSDDRKCDVCDPAAHVVQEPIPEPSVTTGTQPATDAIPMAVDPEPTLPRNVDFVDLTQSPTDEKRPPLERVDSKGQDFFEVS